ncbi:MAG TPA: hypothetical protein VE422_30560 [Terriglobia bacterium]|nr:hypothetical protein [Terriglobia bacterium]
MKHDQPTQLPGIDEMLDWMRQIRTTFEKIDKQAEISAEDKQFAKQFYLKNLPPSIQKAVRKHFPTEFNGNERQEGV